MLTQLQSLRAWAALSVMAFHLGASLAAPKYFGIPWAGAVTQFGYAGMFLFFVLSGFIIHQVHARDFGRPDRAWRYVAKRVFRIYPLYLVLFSLLLIVMKWTGLGEGGIPTGWLALTKALLLLPQDPAVAGGTGAPVIIVAWSLQYEMVFYSVMLLFILDIRLGWLALAALVAAFFVFPRIGAPGLFPAFLEAKYFQFFAIGVGTSMLAQAKTSPLHARVLWRGAQISFVGLWLLSAALSLATEGALVLIDNPGMQIALALLVAALIFGATEYERQGGQRAGGVARRLGDWSYAIYLLHFPVISLANKLAVTAELQAGVAALVVVTGSLALTLAGAALLHNLVERPAMAYARSLVNAPASDVSSAG
ncbi:acyltransferase family protein [Novosphingobium album (ex Liu et al. 2023)]|uniref:Acyltransferase n=1 Tax=Novosphingobium album (ex Liu et al. 2023) TaxID=3031130 RepID=A0ABT5WQW2_9SPHN|nr:acyltransferase [Novosphingobium album (ex Liu et al. 2023)]MDE8652413.1 acyltransferase [Novosphingobium album (ex Liu et al. 2023)]